MNIIVMLIANTSFNFSQPNTFQVVLASSIDTSYAIFTYRCGSLNLNSYSPSTGYTFNSTLFKNHYLSIARAAHTIACLNQPASVWSNVVYKLNLVDGKGTHPFIRKFIMISRSFIFVGRYSN